MRNNVRPARFELHAWVKRASLAAAADMKAHGCLSGGADW